MQYLQRSPFRPAGTMGALSGTRIVELRGTTTASGLFSPNFVNHSDWIATGLRNRGFNIVNVRADTPYTFGDYVLNLEIEANVYDQHSAEEVRQNAIAAIEDYRANYGLNKVYSNTTLSVVYDAAADGGTGGAYNPPSNYDQSNADDQPESEAWVAFWSAMGLSTPPTVATVLAVGGIFAYLMLKR